MLARKYRRRDTMTTQLISVRTLHLNGDNSPSLTSSMSRIQMRAGHQQVCRQRACRCALVIFCIPRRRVVQLNQQDLSPPILVSSTTHGSPLPSSLIISSGSTISVLARHLDVSISWTAWQGKGRATAMLESGGLLVVIGDEDGNRYPVLKIWDLTREDRRRKGGAGGGGPLLLRHVNIQHGQRPHPVSAKITSGPVASAN